MSPIVMTSYRPPDGGEELYCPTVVCDVCGRLIQHDRPGVNPGPDRGIVVWWPKWTDDGVLSMPPLSFVHKGRCDDRIQAERGRSHWNDLDEFVRRLSHNVEHPFEPDARCRVPTVTRPQAIRGAR